MEITDFKKGDIITRTEPTIVRANSLLFGHGIEDDYTPVGKKYELVGIANGIIYCAVIDGEKDRVEFNLTKHKEGWERWIDPDTL